MLALVDSGVHFVAQRSLLMSIFASDIPSGCTFYLLYLDWSW